MSAVPVMINGVLWDKYLRAGRPVVLMGEATIAGLGIGGGPIYPPGGGGGGEQPPLGIWGPPDMPPGFWGGGMGPGVKPQPHPEHPIVLPPDGGQPPEGPADDNGFIKPPPTDGGWAYHEEYGWGYYPPTGGKPKPPGNQLQQGQPQQKK